MSRVLFGFMLVGLMSAASVAQDEPVSPAAPAAAQQEEAAEAATPAEPSPTTAEDSSPLEVARRALEESTKWYEFAPGEDAKPLEPKIVLNWSNREREGSGVMGLTVIWADETRPVAIAAIYPWNSLLMHEVDLLSRNTEIVGKREGRVVWQPQTTSFEFQPVPDAPEPAATEGRRRLQLRDLARQFQATMVGWAPDNSDRQELRMMPQWLYRYGQAESECLDGAVFAFAMGTDPEAVLLLEAFRTGEDKYEWQYAFARRTSGGLEARWKETVVWTAPRLPPDTSPALPHITFRAPLPAEIQAGQ